MLQIMSFRRTKFVKKGLTGNMELRCQGFPTMLPSTFQDKMKEQVLFSTTYISCFVSINNLCDARFWDGVDGFWPLGTAGSVSP